MDNKENEVGLNDEESGKRGSLKLKLESWLKEEMMWRQKSREKSLEEGDPNIKYFHAFTKHRRRCNFINEVSVDNKKIGGNTELREAVRNHFSKLYEEDHVIRPKLDGLSFSSISEESRQLLEVEFTADEVLEGLKSCNGNKAPGPDGFNLKFIQSFLYLMKEDIMGIFKDLHSLG